MLVYQGEYGKNTIFNGKINYKSPFLIAMLVYQRVFPLSNVSSFRRSSLPAACSRGAPGVTSGDPGETEPGGLRTAMVKRWLKDGEMMIYIYIWLIMGLIMGLMMGLIMGLIMGLLVGGLQHCFYEFPYIGNVIIPTDELHHFSEG